ncbi:MAG TPA: TonB-dependent receptor [Ferruginibacter sp.]|nr:TonB-dependent receptor [Ferruginibacter sp.]HRE63254.1 TonB-dependent receptor [Ferruginibacter sp.]
MHFKKIIPMVIALFAIPLFMMAQVTTSNSTGFVKNGAGEALVGATVKATHIPTGKVYQTTTRTGGRFDIINMNPGGPYTFDVTYVGQTIPGRADVYLQLGATESFDFVASESSQQLETVVVSGARTNRTVKNGTTSNFNQRVIASLPNISRSITNITTLTPQAGGGNSFGGRDGRYNNIQIDGASFNNNFGTTGNALPGGAVSPISLDAIDEISVNVSPYDVRQANFTGAGISATTKRGTNRFTGSVYAFYRDQGFLGRKAVGQKVPTVTQSSSKIFGGRLGGPIIKNKLFFFLSAETDESDAPGIVWKATRTGTTPDANTSRTLATDLDAVSDYLRNNFGYETGPYENLGNFATKNKKFLGRIDWNVNSKHTVSLRYNYSKTDDDQLLNGTSAPNPRSASNRWSRNSMSYDNSNYANTSILKSYAFEVKSNFTNKLSNQFIATYTDANDPKRSSKSAIFPFIDIQKDGDSYISAGYELFSYNNDVQNTSLTINNNLTYTTGKHLITAGAAYEKIYVKNQFLRYGTSYYRFSSVSDFLNNNAPNAFGLTYAYAGQKPFVELDFGQASLYAQDEISVNNKLKFVLGLRLDKPLFQNELTGNPAIEALNFADLNGNQKKFNVGVWPKERIYFSPRAGFNWDVNANKDLIIRGGSGVFTGRFPFVWFTNQPSNSGVIQNTVERTGSAAAGFLFNQDPMRYLDSFPSAPGTSSPGSLAIVDPKFKMPQVWRTSLAFDKRLGKDWTLTMEAIYNKDINALLQYNANLRAPIGTTAGPGGRPLFGNSNATRRINPSISEAMVLSNTNKGGAGIFTLQIAKRFSDNWDFSAAYTHTESMDKTGNPGSQAASAWSNTQSIRGNNDLDLAYSDFGTPNRVVSYVSYKMKWNKMLATTVTLVYTGYEQFRYSYRYSNDYNQDGISSDLIYVPKSPSEITFVNYSNNGPTAAQQSEAFFNYVKQDPYLSKRQGKYAERNGAKMPWFSNLDLRVLQDILPYAKDRRYGLQLSMEIENFTNLVNSAWGVTRSLTYNNGAILSVVSAPTTTTPATYRMNLVNGALPTESTYHNITVGNTWRMNLGVRLNF